MKQYWNEKMSEQLILAQQIYLRQKPKTAASDLQWLRQRRAAQSVEPMTRKRTKPLQQAEGKTASDAGEMEQTVQKYLHSAAPQSGKGADMEEISRFFQRDARRFQED